MVIIKHTCTNPNGTFQNLGEFLRWEYGLHSHHFDSYGLYIEECIENKLILDRKTETFDVNAQQYTLHLYSNNEETAQQFLEYINSKECYINGKKEVAEYGWISNESIIPTPPFSSNMQPTIKETWLKPYTLPF